MDKTTAIKLLGGTAKLAADAIGITPQAVGQWPDVLPSTISDRVQAAIARTRLPPEILGLPKAAKTKVKA